MFSLAHISDIHLSPLPHVSVGELLSKRVTGLANWKLKRAKSMGNEALSALIADMKRHQPDHIAITGDIVNLALPAEFAASKLWLENLGPPDQISVVPGNHDAYVPNALPQALKAWGDYMPASVTDQMARPSINAGFPFIKRVGPVAIIGVSSATASPPLFAIGYFQKQQAIRLDRILRETADQDLFRVVLIHHPPFRYQNDAAKRLYGVRLFQKTVLDAGAELILHGHTHIVSMQHIRDHRRAIPVIGVPSASQSHGGHRPAAQWNEFKISGQNKKWNVELDQRGLNFKGSIEPIGSIRLWQNGQVVVDPR